MDFSVSNMLLSLGPQPGAHVSCTAGHVWFENKLEQERRTWFELILESLEDTLQNCAAGLVKHFHKNTICYDRYSPLSLSNLTKIHPLTFMLLR